MTPATRATAIGAALTADERVVAARARYAGMALKLGEMAEAHDLNQHEDGARVACRQCQLTALLADAASLSLDLANAAASDERRPDFRAQ